MKCFTIFTVSTAVIAGSFASPVLAGHTPCDAASHSSVEAPIMEMSMGMQMVMGMGMSMGMNVERPVVMRMELPMVLAAWASDYDLPPIGDTYGNIDGINFDKPGPYSPPDVETIDGINDVSAVPLPAPILLLIGSMGALFGMRRRTRA